MFSQTQLRLPKVVQLTEQEAREMGEMVWRYGQTMKKSVQNKEAGRLAAFTLLRIRRMLGLIERGTDGP